MDSLTSIVEAIRSKAEASEPLKKTLKFNFGDEQLYIDGTGEKNNISLEDKDADCQIDVSFIDFLALTKGELKPMSALMGGKIKIKGDMGVAMKLQSIFG